MIEYPSIYKLMFLNPRNWLNLENMNSINLIKVKNSQLFRTDNSHYCDNNWPGFALALATKTHGPEDTSIFT